MAKAKNGVAPVENETETASVENQAQISSSEPAETENEATDAIESVAESPVQVGISVENTPSEGEEPRANGPKLMKIKNLACAGMKIGSASGVVEFDKDGIAEVGADNYAHLLKIPGYEAAE